MKKTKTLPIKSAAPIGIGFGDLLGVPVQVWWGLEWVKTTGYPENEQTISARLVTRTGETKMCRIRNTKSQTHWKHA
jgi:hypothetical protein